MLKYFNVQLLLIKVGKQNHRRSSGSGPICCLPYMDFAIVYFIEENIIFDTVQFVVIKGHTVYIKQNIYKYQPSILCIYMYLNTVFYSATWIPITVQGGFHTRQKQYAFILPIVMILTWFNMILTYSVSL